MVILSLWCYLFDIVAFVMFKKFAKFKILILAFVVVFLYSLTFYGKVKTTQYVHFLPLNYLESDLKVINHLASSVGFYLYVMDQSVLVLSEDGNFFSKPEEFAKEYFRFGIDYRLISKLGIDEVKNKIKDAGFDVNIFYYENPTIQLSASGSHLPIALILHKSYIYVLHIFYPREDNTWWFGSLAGDKQCLLKLEDLLSSSYFSCTDKKWHEGALNRFHFTSKRPLKNSLPHILRPNYENQFFRELQDSNFIECNMTRAALFKSKYGTSKSPAAQRFKHRAWKLLSKTKTIFDLLSISFWLSSGTCLGYFRECDIIPYSKDVDIGVLAKDFNETIITEMEYHGLKLKHWFGLVNDSLELSFIDEGGVKLDIFFFYAEGNYLWNGGTQLRTRKKFKYVFPKFDLCWTLFCGLKVKIPCQTEDYIISNYGANWFTPVKEWDWKTSPNNVHFNGYWPMTISSSRLF